VASNSTNKPRRGGKKCSHKKSKGGNPQKGKNQILVPTRGENLQRNIEAGRKGGEENSGSTDLGIGRGNQGTSEKGRKGTESRKYLRSDRGSLWNSRGGGNQGGALGARNQGIVGK